MDRYKPVIYGFILMGVIACNQKTPSNDEKDENKIDNTHTNASYLITNKSVGSFQLGELIPSPNSLKTNQIEEKKQIRITDSGPVNETIYSVSKNDSTLLILKPANKESSISSISEIMILSDTFHTKEGIGIGSTIDEFMGVYPNVDIWYTYVSDRYVMETSDYPSIQFLLRKQDFTGELIINDVKTELSLVDFKDSTKIFKIRVYKRPMLDS